MFNFEFLEAARTKRAMSLNDRVTYDRIITSLKIVDGHFQIPLPWKERSPCLPDNKSLALRRLFVLKGRLERDPICKMVEEQTIKTFMTPYGEEAVRLANRSFYVDDCLINLPTKRAVMTMAKQFKEALASEGFNPTGFFSNVEEALCDLLEAISNTTSLHIDRQPDYVRRTLVVLWENTTDCFCFKVESWNSIPTRRALLSYVASFFDPLGIVAPVLLPAKCRNQNLCRRKASWDDIMPGNETLNWKNWLLNLQMLKAFEYHATKLHAFSDASETGYGAAIYIRLTDPPRIPHSILLIGKSRVAPIKYTGILRLELTAVVLSVKLTACVRDELAIETDSMTVLQVIRNRTTRYDTFVAYRLAPILGYSEPEA
ncbi:Pao retrotransposon peptidase [Opisthorchis viverrini]|uniref:Pao retrotransposon peptidase n=1 Tax=Opisthorchis viverrini TaxID=6198 RepID=A0A1S8WZV9_OPIVI|nr:Pao retrotransposon peptidase [Opisthorchis viverrini]